MPTLQFHTLLPAIVFCLTWAAGGTAADDDVRFEFRNSGWHQGRVFLTVAAHNLSGDVLADCTLHLEITDSRTATISGQPAVRFGALLPGETVTYMFEVHDEEMGGFDFEADLTWNPEGEPPRGGRVPRWLETEMTSVQNRIAKHNALDYDATDSGAAADYDLEARAINLDRDRVNRLLHQYRRGVQPPAARDRRFNLLIES